MDIIDLDISETHYDGLARRARAEQVPLQVITERILQTALDLPEPAYRYAQLLCSRCGTTKHRYTRTRLTPGTYQFYFGCLACFRIRKHGTAPVKGLPAPAPRPAPPPAPARGTSLAAPR